MPEIHWSLDVGDLLIVLIGLVLIPVTRTLINTMWSVREAIQELTMAVFGSDKEPGSGIIAHVSELQRESARHRNWLIKLSAETGVKQEDRS